MGAWGSVTVEDGRTWSSQSVDGSGNPAPLSGGVTVRAIGRCLASVSIRVAGLMKPARG